MEFQITNVSLPLNIVFVLANSVNPTFVVSQLAGSSLFGKVPVLFNRDHQKINNRAFFSIIRLFFHQCIIPMNSLFPSIPDSFHQ